MMRGLGYRPDPFDPRDRSASKALRVTSAPARVPRSRFTKTLDQGGLGSCTTNAAAQAVRAEMLREFVREGWSLEEAQKRVEFLSRLWGYYFARAITHDTGEDTGTYIRNVFKVLAKLGFPFESVWPYSDDASREGRFRKMPGADAVRQAYDRRVRADNAQLAVVSYSRITSAGNVRVAEVKKALSEREGRLVVFGTSVTNAFCTDMSANGGKPIEPPTNGKDIAGGHAMVWGGYDEDGPDTLNSWGDEFGDDGWFKMSWDYVAWDATQDLWVVESAPLFHAGLV